MHNSATASNETKEVPGDFLARGSSPALTREWPPAEPGSLASRITSIWKEVLEVEQVEHEDNFFDLGGNSLRAVQALLAIEAVCERELPVAFLYQHPTFSDLIAALQSELPPAAHSSLIAIQQGTLPPLFWLPGATSNTTILLGNAAYIFRLARALGPERTVYSVYQEHQADATLPTIEKMAANLLRDVISTQPTGPYYLAGWSFGGLLAYEMARQLHEAGREVALVAVVDQVGPGYPRRRPWRQRPMAFWNEWRRRPAPAKWTDPVTSLIRSVRVEITQLFRKLGRIFGRRNDWDRVIRLETEYLRAHRPYSGHVTLFVSPETLLATEGAVSTIHDPNLGWGALSPSVETHVLSGTHHTIFDEPRLPQLTDVLLQRMAESLPSAS